MAADEFVIAVLVVAMVGLSIWTRPWRAPDHSPPTAQAPKESLRPQARACAGTVTNNPAILAWRKSQGCVN